VDVGSKGMASDARQTGGGGLWARWRGGVGAAGDKSRGLEVGWGGSMEGICFGSWWGGGVGIGFEGSRVEVGMVEGVQRGGSWKHKRRHQ
jgi:hypothetical protein